MRTQSDPPKKTISSWYVLVEKLVTPVRYPRFPELTLGGEWKKWVPDPKPKDHKTSTVEQPPWARPWPRAKKHLKFYRPLQYKPLPDGSIRLLDLREAKMIGDVLTGFKLMTTDLTTAPSYEAISYCWGSTDLCTGIFVSTRNLGEQVYRITENLAGCLHSLMTSERPDQEKPDYIWVDQICINQEDVAERNAQVRHMADIYKTAAGVIVWLGQKSELSVESTTLVLQPDPYMQWRGASILHWVVDWAIFARPWFFRQWIFQEAVFAQYISVLLGSVFMPWTAIEDLGQTLSDFENEDSKIEYPFLVESMSGWLPAWIALSKADMSDQGHVDLPTFMYSLQDQKCQDPRDKVFSLVGFAGDLLPAGFVDYKQPIEAILQRCTRSLIEATGDLNAITYASPDAGDWTLSWVPLWHKRLYTGVRGYVRLPHASQNRVWKPPTCVIEDQLVVSGRLKDIVVVELESFRNSMSAFFFDNKGELGEPLRNSYQETLDHFKDTIMSEDDSSSLDRRTMAFPESRTLEPSQIFIRRFLRAVFCDDRKLSASDREELFEVLVDESGHPEHKREAALAEFLRWGQHPYGRLLLLKSGLLGYNRSPGQGPEAGDCVAILHGLDVPCLLRKSENGEGWLYVTDIYVDGMMYGKAVDWEEDEADTFTLV